MIVPNNCSLSGVIVELRSQSGPRFDLKFLGILALKVVLVENFEGFLIRQFLYYGTANKSQKSKLFL
jgi:hypothetical protein